MQATDWLWVLHPALAVVLVYPLLGMVPRLAQQTRDHADLGKWLAGSVVAIVLLAEVVVIVTKHPLTSFEGGGLRLALLLLELVGSGVALAALIFLAQGISGRRDLLEIPLSWQKATIYGGNFEARTCPGPAPSPPSP